MFKKPNRYPALFSISIFIFLLLAILIGLYLRNQYAQVFLENNNLIASTGVFLFSCALTVPNVIIALFFSDDKTWEDRLVQLSYAQRLADLRKKDLSVETNNEPLSKNEKRAFREHVLGRHRSGKFVRWSVFNRIMRDEVANILTDKCTTRVSHSDAENYINQAEHKIRSLYKLNNQWFRSTTIFMIVWSFISAVGLFGAFYWLTETYQGTFMYWYKFEGSDGFVRNWDYFYYVLNATVKGFIANLFEIFNQNPPFFVRESIESVWFLEAKSTLVQVYEYIFRTLMATSLIPIAVAFLRMVRMWRLPKKLQRRIGVGTRL